MPHMRFFPIAFITAILSGACSCVCFAQSAKLVECSGDRVYRDNRNEVGGQVFCEQVLPGSVTVKDGPFRFWFNPNFEGSSGNYNQGREAGKWKECDRFGRCEQKEYPAVYPEEKQRAGFRPEIPVAWVNGKYVFDFGSCRQTEVTHTDGSKPDLTLGIRGTPGGCFISYAPADSMGHDGNTDYTCTIPFQVGRRAFDSLDLLTELPKAGLPQYCARPVIRTGPYMSSVTPERGEGPAQVFTAEYSLGNNGVGIRQTRLHFQDRAESRSNRCVARYDPGSNGFYLLSDQPGKYLGPITPGGSASLSNGQCLLSGCSTAEISNGVLKVHFAIRFNPDRFAGEHGIFLEMVDTNHQASPAPEYGHWTVPPASGPAARNWPSDRSCPQAMLVPPPGYWTTAPGNCNEVSGKWTDPENGGTWVLAQSGDRITGSLTMSKGTCGEVTWQVAGHMSGGLASLTAVQPSPSVDSCGVAAAASISMVRKPNCTSTAQGATGGAKKRP